VQTYSSILNFILLMVLNPEVQQRAQEELDKVIGRDRLPDFADKESLPYIGAVCKEALRWFPNVPLSVSHAVSADDEYKGMKIPKKLLSLLTHGLLPEIRIYTDLILMSLAPSVILIQMPWTLLDLSSDLDAGYAQEDTRRKTASSS